MRSAEHASVIPARLVYAGLAVATIVLGLSVHLNGAALGSTSRDVAGDALWAAMLSWWAGALAPARPLSARSAAALTICFVVEASQLLHTPTLDLLRRTTIGRLTLGSGFDPRDLLSYSVGVLAAAFLEWSGRRWLGRRARPVVA